MDTIQKNNQERALHTSDTSVEVVNSPLDVKETKSEQLFKMSFFLKKKRFLVRNPMSSSNMCFCVGEKKSCRWR